MLAPLFAIFLSLLPMSHGVGKPRILVLPDSTAPAPTGFIEALRIQLAGTGQVEPGPAMTGDSITAKVAHAARAVATTGAILAVWIERAPRQTTDAIGAGQLEFVLYVVGRDHHHALIEVFHLAAADQPVIDRALALKVREVLDGVLVDEHVAPPPGWLGDSTTLRRNQLLVEVGWSVAPGWGAPATQHGPVLALGLRRDIGSLDADLFATTRWVDGFSATSFAGEVTTSEVPLAAGLRVMGGSRLTVGAQVELGVRRIRADGVTPFGARGSIVRWIPTGLLGLTAAYPLRPGTELRALLGVDLALHRLHLAVNDVAILDIGRVHPSTYLTLAIVLP